MCRIILILTLIAGLNTPVKSQASLQINYFMSTDVTVLTPTTTSANLFNVVVQNVSLVDTFSNNLNVNVGVVDTLGQVQVMDIVDKGFQTINSNDTLTLDTVHINVNPSYFVDGNNTVVIWPAASGTYTNDSLVFTFTYNNVNEVENRDINIKLGPNPATESLYLGDPENMVKQVRIRTVDGKLLRKLPTNEFIFVGNLHEGIYLVEIETIQGLHTRKLIIQH
jgi:hypothetical protein